MNRRGFLGALGLALAAPAIVRADSLMRVVPVHTLLLWGDGIHDDTVALQSLVDGSDRVVMSDQRTVYRRNQNGSIFLAAGTYAIRAPLVITGGGHTFDRVNLRCQHDGPALEIQSFSKVTGTPAPTFHQPTKANHARNDHQSRHRSRAALLDPKQGLRLRPRPR